MKKNLLGWLAMAAMLVGTGCSTDEVVNDFSQGNAIQFGTYVGRDAQARGSVITTDGGTTNSLASTALTSFGVFAYYTDNGGLDLSTLSLKPNFMYNQDVNKTTYTSGTDNVAYSTGWKYEPIKYWPNESTDKLSFFAYAPYESGKEWNGAQIDITIADDVTNQVDYLVASTNNTIDLTKQTVGEKVTFTFGHALSRVGFKVEAVIDENNESNGTDPDTDSQTNPKDENTVITVQEVELLGNFYKSAKLNLNTGEWNYVGATSATSYELKQEAGDFTEAANGVGITKAELNRDSEYMMLIPKNFEGDDKIKVRVKYTVTTMDGKLEGDKSVVENDITSDAFNFEFKKGNAYDFVLHLGLTSVKLSATVSDWIEQDVVANVPMNNNDSNSSGAGSSTNP